MKHLRHIVILILLAAIGCSKAGKASDIVSINLITEPECRSADPDESLITDANLFIFRQSGEMEHHIFLNSRDLASGAGGSSVSMRLLTMETYDFYACCNTGPLDGIRDRESLLGYRHHMAYPDEYSRGIPMTAVLTCHTIGEDRTVNLPMVRALSKIMLSIDRTALDPDIRFTVRKVRVGGCPTSALLFGSGRDPSQAFFDAGFTKSGAAVAPLNAVGAGGISGELPLYLLENLSSDSTSKPFIEIEIDYFGNGFHSGQDQFLIYRFHTEEATGESGVERGRSYRFTVKPHGTGISDDPWRTDTSRLGRDNRE